MTGLRSQPRHPRSEPLPEKLRSGRTGNHDRPARSQVGDADGNGLQPRTGLRPAARVRHRHPGPLPRIHLHSLLEGGVSWHKEAEATEEGIPSGDYHEYFKISIARRASPKAKLPIARSRLVFNGKAGIGLNTTPTTCPGPQTTHLRVEPYVGPAATASYTSTPTAAEENCKVLAVRTEILADPIVHPLRRPRRDHGRTRLSAEQIVLRNRKFAPEDLRSDAARRYDHQSGGGPWPGSMHARTVRGRHRSHVGVVPVALGDRHRRVERARTASRIAQGQDLPGRAGARSDHRARRTRSTSPWNRLATASSCALKAASSPISPRDS